MLPQQTLDGPVELAEAANPPPGSPQESYLLQAGSFRQREDADRRRAELLLLGLNPAWKRPAATTAAGSGSTWVRFVPPRNDPGAQPDCRAGHRHAAVETRHTLIPDADLNFQGPLPISGLTGAGEVSVFTI